MMVTLVQVHCWRCNRVIGEKESGTGRFILKCHRCGAKNVVDLSETTTLDSH